MSTPLLQLGRHWGIPSFAALIAGLAYLLLPNDLIPDAEPWGYADDAAVNLALGLAAWFLAPPDWRRRTREGAAFRLRVLRADLGNFGPIEHRYVDGFVFSAKNSGSHWLKYMLSVGIAEAYGLPPPRFTSGRHADEIVGRASRARSRRPFPQIATAHTVPSALMAPILRLAGHRLPPIVLLVRDIEAALLSNYRKWRGLYGVPFATFIEGDPSGRRFIADPWWYAHFFNRWGALHRAAPDRILLVRYEEMERDPEGVLRRAAAHLGLRLTDAEVGAAAAAAARDRMRALQDPEAGEIILPDPAEPAPYFTAHDRRVLHDILARTLREPLGYETRLPRVAGRLRRPDTRPVDTTRA